MEAELNTTGCAEVGEQMRPVGIPETARRFRPRFSLRMLLVLTVFVALFCWWRQRPAAFADRFNQAIEAKHYAAADALFKNPDQPFVVAFMKRDARNRITAKRERQSPGDWLKGDCRMTIALEDFSGAGATIVIKLATDAWGMRNFGFEQVTNSVQVFPAPLPGQAFERD
jgi:hypothetical protein